MAKKQIIPIHNEAMRTRALDFIRGLDIEKSWEVTVGRFRQQRSSPQNALIHKWFGHIAEETGDTQDGVKETMIQLFSPVVESKFKPGVMRHKRTHEMDTAEMTDFVNRIYQCACEYGIFLPHPDDRGRE